MSRLPATTAQLRVLHQSFSQRLLEGEVSAGGFQWTFSWFFDRGELPHEICYGCGEATCQRKASGKCF